MTLLLGVPSFLNVCEAVLSKELSVNVRIKFYCKCESFSACVQAYGVVIEISEQTFCHNVHIEIVSRLCVLEYDDSKYFFVCSDTL